MVVKEQCVLIVDDEPVICDLLDKELSERGYCCTVVPDGKKALDALAVNDFDVTLLDIRLPGISGMEILRRMRQYYPDVAAIMITAIGEVNTAVQAMQLGASDYIVKPFELDRIDASIRTVVRSKNRLSVTGGEKPPNLAPRLETSEGKALNRMNLIAGCVDRRLNLLTGHSSIVTERTAEIACELGIPQKAIEKWVATRTGLEFQKNSVGRVLVGNVKRSLFAEAIMAASKLMLQEPELGDSQN